MSQKKLNSLLTSSRSYVKSVVYRSGQYLIIASAQPDQVMENVINKYFPSNTIIW